MSLEAIRAVRRSGHKPDTPVLIVVGRCPKWARNLPHVVSVPADANPALMDMRPLVGVWVAVLLLDPLYALGARVMDAVTEAGAKFYGAASPLGIHLCIADPTPAHEQNLKATWRLYADHLA